MEVVLELGARVLPVGQEVEIRENDAGVMGMDDEEAWVAKALSVVQYPNVQAGQLQT